MANISLIITVGNTWEKVETLMGLSFVDDTDYQLQSRGDSIMVTESDAVPTTEAGLVIPADGGLCQYKKTAGFDLYVKTCGVSTSKLNITMIS